MDEILRQMIEVGGLPAVCAFLSGLVKYILTIGFLMSGINAFQKYTSKE